MAGSFSWTFDAPSGTYKNHDLSEKLRDAAIADTQFMQFVQPEAGYGKRQGDTITITRVSNISQPTSGKLTENQKIPEDVLSLSTVSITVSEWGRSVPYTSLSDDLSKFDVSNIVQKKLKDQLKLVMDKAAASAFKSTSAKVCAIPTGAAALTFDTDGTPSSAATVNLNVYHVEQIRDYMYSTLNVPPYEGDDYIGLIATKAKRGLMSDPAWEQWHKYTDPSNKFNSEIGRLENIRFIEVGNTNSLSGSIGTGSVLGEGVFFGDDAVAMAVAEDPHLRMAIPGDYGRSKGVAWYGILEFGVVWDTANAGEARIVRLTSS
ncbi:MAG TPA: N4-gp56 family major capsid protein [Pyrinomonadaceae bacterium]|nr:N4-gp56 family major capsid protein [Pyrinomonadaceae bacterium]